MEMTFPHFAASQDSVSRFDFEAMLLAVVARQANSQTVRILRQAERHAQPQGSDAKLRIDYFARGSTQKTAVRGGFWRNVQPIQNAESSVYQAGSGNFKVLNLHDEATGEQLNHAGHGALRKL